MNMGSRYGAEAKLVQLNCKRPSTWVLHMFTFGLFSRDQDALMHDKDELVSLEGFTCVCPMESLFYFIFCGQFSSASYA